MQELGLKSVKQWDNWCKSGQKPDDIPARPNNTYKEQWKGWGDWLGTGTIALQNKVYRSFEEAHEYVMQLGFKTREEYSKWCKSGQKPDDIPARPNNTYKEQWKGWGDWLGTGYIALTKRDYLPFEDARKYVRGLKLKNQDQWNNWCKSGQKPANIPGSPSNFYKKKWKGVGDWLGTGYIATTKRHYLLFEEAHKYVMQLGFKTREEYSKWCKSGKKPDDIPADPAGGTKNNGRVWVIGLAPDILFLLTELTNHLLKQSSYTCTSLRQYRQMV